MLQSGADLRIAAWAVDDEAQPMVIVSTDSDDTDWNEFVSFLTPSYAPIVADVSSAYELILLSWEIGEPVVLLSQGNVATDWIASTVASARGAVTALFVATVIFRLNELPTCVRSQH
ncbi:MAG: hypothetical protein CL726_05585 [Chloroflexi bacterium]|nr:hypothetical protein [Chloroflexota bacterium]